MMHIFIDESGQFSGSTGEYFIVASFTVGDPRRTQKSFKGWKQSHFPRKMRNQSEIKWSSSSISKSLRLRTLRHISKMDVRIRYTYLKKKNIPAQFRDENKVQQGLLYTAVIGDTLDMYMPSEETCVEVICDQKDLPGISKKEFRGQLRAGLLLKLPRGATVNIQMIDSTTSNNIQIVDWIAGALAHYHEHKNEGEEYFSIIKNNILDGSGKEIFSDPIPY